MLKSTHAFKKHGRTLLVLALIIGLNPHLVIAIDYGIPAGFSFQTNLKQGDTVNPDVNYLQSILNSRPETKVAETGPGSPTQLTSYFGALTKAAVMKFQKLYRSEVLTPAGLASPTGTVGQFTRNKLNALLGKTSIINQQQPIQTTTTVTATTGKSDGKGIITAPANTKLLDSAAFNRATTTYGMMLYALPKATTTASGLSTRIGGLYLSGLSAYQTRPGLVMSVFGSGFTTENNVFLGPVSIGQYSSNTSGTQITFKVPEYMPRGFYQVAVSNKYGTTTTGDDIYLGIDRPQNVDIIDTRPVINTITPNYTRYPNDLILINGQNFTLNNTIVTNLGDLKNVISTDGKNITFLVGSLPFFSKAQAEYKGASINLVIKVKNENGTSTDKINHVISFPLNTSEVNQNIQSAAVAALNNSLMSTARTGTTTSTTTRSTANSSNSGSKSSSNSSNSSSDIMSYLKPVASPGADLLRQLDPNFKAATDPIVNTNFSQYQTITGGSGNSGGNSSSGGSSILGGAAAGASLGGGSGSGSSSGGSSGGKQVDYFGGTITRTTLCTCDGTTLITVDDYATNGSVTMLYDPTQSKLNMNFNIWTTGVYVIGGFMSGGGQCQVYNGESCDTQGTAQYTVDNIRGIGTSTY
jgi:hypothetical protein